MWSDFEFLWTGKLISATVLRPRFPSAGLIRPDIIRPLLSRNPSILRIGKGSIVNDVMILMGFEYMDILISKSNAA